MIGTGLLVCTCAKFHVSGEEQTIMNVEVMIIKPKTQQTLYLANKCSTIISITLVRNVLHVDIIDLRTF